MYELYDWSGFPNWPVSKHLKTAENLVQPFLKQLLHQNLSLFNGMVDTGFGQNSVILLQNILANIQLSKKTSVASLFGILWAYIWKKYIYIYISLGFFEIYMI